MFLGYFALYPFANPTAWVLRDLRYMYPALPVVALLIGASLPAVRTGVWLWLGATTVVAVALTAWGLVGLHDLDKEGEIHLASAGIEDVVDRLEELGVARVISDMGGAQITFASDGKIRASNFLLPRFAELERVSLVREPSTYVLFLGTDNAQFLQEKMFATPCWIRP